MQPADAVARFLLVAALVGLAAPLAQPVIAGMPPSPGRLTSPDVALAFPSTSRENESASLAADMALRLGLGNVTGVNVTYVEGGLELWFDGLNNSLLMFTGSADDVVQASTQSGAVLDLHYNATWPPTSPIYPPSAYNGSNGSFLYAEVYGYPRNVSSAGSPRAFLSGIATALGVSLDGTEELSEWFYGTYVANDMMSATLYRPAFGKPVEFGDQFQVRAWSANGTVEVLRLFPWMSAVPAPALREPDAFVRTSTYINGTFHVTHYSLDSWVQRFAFDARTGRFAYSFRLKYAGEDFSHYGDLHFTVWLDAQTGGVLLVDLGLVVPQVQSPSFPLLPILAAALVSALLVAVGLASALDESTRFLVLSAVGFPFFTLRKEQALDHFVRGQIFEYLREHPGATFTDLKDHLSLNNGTAAHHLMVLERMGFLASRREGRTKRFFRVDVTTKSIPSILSPLQYNILSLLAQEPLSQGDLARRLDYSKQRVSYNVKRLRRDGYVDLAAEGRVLRLTTKGSMTLADQDTAEGDAWSPPSGS